MNNTTNRVVQIRSSTDDDVQAISAIYAFHVCHATGTFETQPPSADEMGARRLDVLSKGLPYLVAVTGEKVVGFAYANWFKPRPAYRFSAEDSIYMAPDAVGLGWGRLLLQSVLTECEAAGLRKIMAVIGDSDNHASIALHRSLGFTDAGMIRSCGWKFGRWLDIVLMEKALGQGDSCPPQELPEA